jgi:hypothetical protein
VTISRRKGAPETIPVSDLSITWMEVLEARDAGIPVMTFARQKTLDESELRRRNAQLKSLKMVHVHAGHYRLFDFLEWTTHQPRDNWIEKFVTLTELRDRVLAWVNAVPAMTTTPSRLPEVVPSVAATIAVFVEGRSDALLVTRLIDALNLALRADVIPVGGKASLIDGLGSTAAAYLPRYDTVLFLVDADTEDEAAAAAELARLRQRLPVGGAAKRVFLGAAVPSSDAWLDAMFPDLAPSTERHHLHPALGSRQLTVEDIERGVAESSSLRAFVSSLREIAGEQVERPTLEDIESMLILRAKEVIAEGRKQSASTTLTVEFDLDSEEEIQAALRLEEKGRAHVENVDGKWRMSYTEDHPLADID